MQTLKSIVLSVAASLLLGGCAMDVLHPQGPVGVAEAYLLAETTAAMLIVVVPVIIMTFLFAWRYRASATASTYAPEWSYSGRLELLVWGVPLVIIVFLSVVVWRSTHRLDPFQPLPGHAPILNVDVVAMDWKWLFIYPDLHIATVNQLIIPAGTQVAFKITSNSVMNVFFIPQLGTQIYAMAGMQTQLHLMAKNTGEFRGISANFSGAGFPDMRFMTRAITPAAFNGWVAQVQDLPANLTMQAYQKLARPSTNNAVAYYGAVDPNLFSNILAEFNGTATPPLTLSLPSNKVQ